MDREKAVTVLERLNRKFEEATQMKRVVIPSHIVDRLNDEVYTDEGKTLREMAITVPLDFDESNEEVLFDLLVETYHATGDFKNG